MSNAATQLLSIFLAMTTSFAATAETASEAETDPAQTAALARAHDQELRREMTERGLKYLAGIAKDGVLGDTRQKAVTALFLLACLSSGHRLDDPEYGAAMRDSADWLLKNSPLSFLGGSESPNEDHAFAALACMELAGTGLTDHGGERNLALYKKARAALEFSLAAQDKSADANYGGGWRPDDKTRANDRMLTAWFMLELKDAQLRDENIPKNAIDRALDFIRASQKTEDDGKSDELGGFSVDATGLRVSSATGVGAFAFSIYGGEREAEHLRLAKDWLKAHPAQWKGPHYFPTHFFISRALFRTQAPGADDYFAPYFQRVVRQLREHQDADGSFPFPPREGELSLKMGRGYSTALAILILNVDRGFLPLDY